MWGHIDYEDDDDMNQEKRKEEEKKKKKRLPWKKILSLVISYVLIFSSLFLAKLIPLIDNSALKILLNISIYLIMGGIALASMKINKMQIDFDWKNYKQYIFGVLFALVMAFIIGVIPALLGYSMVGSHVDFVPWKLIYSIFFYLVIVGPIEELVFRIYFQDLVCSFFETKKWIGVLIVALLFGIFHIVNGIFIQVIFTFVIGCLFGFAKQYLKDLKFPGLSIWHGLYDLLCYIVTLTIA